MTQPAACEAGICFNGAALRGARKRQTSSSVNTLVGVLQWGRAPRSAETIGVVTATSPRARGFNGAALRGARKPGRRLVVPPAPTRFNGAALRGARKPCG